MRRNKFVASLLLAVVASLVVVGVALAHTEAIEWAENPGSFRYSLDYLGTGNGNCDDNDSAFAIVKTFSADPSRYRIYSDNFFVRFALGPGSSVFGHDLETASNAYLCVGLTDTIQAGGAGNIEANMFVWIQ